MTQIAAPQRQIPCINPPHPFILATSMLHSPDFSLALIAITAFMLTMLLIPAAMKLAPFIRAMDQPDSRKIHSRAIPRTGGLAMAGGLSLIASLFFAFFAFVSGHWLCLSIAVALLGSLFGLLAMSLRTTPEWLQMAAGLSMASLLYGTAIYLQHSGWRWRSRLMRWLKRAYRNRIYRRMTTWAGRSVPIVAKLIPLAMALPIFFLHPLPTPVVWLTLFVSVIAALLFPWRAPIDRLRLSHGAIYLVAFTLLSLYLLYGTPWIATYTAWMTATLAVWVVFKLLFKRHLKISLTSGFELLIIILSWFVPLGAHGN